MKLQTPAIQLQNRGFKNFQFPPEPVLLATRWERKEQQLDWSN